jgi:hypothetical protein
MYVLSIPSTEAVLVVTGHKNILNKGFGCPDRVLGKRFLVHSSGTSDMKKIEDSIPEGIEKGPILNDPQVQRLITVSEGVIGSVLLAQCIHETSSPWADKYGAKWDLRDPAAFENVYHCRGHYGFFEIDEDLIQKEEAINE